MSKLENLESHVEELNEKVSQLKSELSAAISEIISIKSADIVKALLNIYNLKGNTAELSWQFYPEGDDEGGTVYYPENLTLKIDGEEIDLYDHVAPIKSSWSNNYYETELGEAIREQFLSDLSEQLHSDGVEQLVIDISENGEEN